MTRSRKLLFVALPILLLASCVPIPPLETPVVEPNQAPDIAMADLTEPSPTAQPALSPTSSATPPAVATSTVAPSATATEAASVTPAASRTLAPTESSARVAAAANTPTRTARPTATSTRRPTATRSLPTRTPIPTPTVDKHRVIITEADIARSITGGAAAQQGIVAQNLKVDFGNGKMRVTADRLGYGLMQLQNLDLTGRLVASNGALQLVVESMAPRGLAANLVPRVANQALAQLAAQWYVEEVKTLDDRVELRVR